MQNTVLFPRWEGVPEVCQAAANMEKLARQHAQLADSKDTDDRSQARKLWAKLSESYWDTLFALLDAQTENMPEQLTFDDNERLFIDFGFPGEGILPVHRDFDGAKALGARCGGGIFPCSSFSDYIAECWAMITGAQLPVPAIGLSTKNRIDCMMEELEAAQRERDDALWQIVEGRDISLDVNKLVSDLDNLIFAAQKVAMRVPEYREGKEADRQAMSQDRFRYVEAENAILLMVSSAQKASENPLPLPDAEHFLQLHERTKVISRKIIYSQNDVRKTERRAQKIASACSQFTDLMKRKELRNMVVKKREYLSVPAKTARCDTSPLCPSSSAPIDCQRHAEKLEALCALDMDMFAVPRIRMYGVPRAIFVPGQGLGTYDWADHSLLLPVFPVGSEEKSLSYALGTFRWDSDEDRRLKNPYEQQIKENKGKSILALSASFCKDYSLWLTKEKQGYRILPRETYKVFNLMFAPRQEEA